MPPALAPIGARQPHIRDPPLVDVHGDADQRPGGQLDDHRPVPDIQQQRCVGSVGVQGEAHVPGFGGQRPEHRIRPQAESFVALEDSQARHRREEEPVRLQRPVQIRIVVSPLYCLRRRVPARELIASVLRIWCTQSRVSSKPPTSNPYVTVIVRGGAPTIAPEPAPADLREPAWHSGAPIGNCECRRGRATPRRPLPARQPTRQRPLDQQHFRARHYWDYLGRDKHLRHSRTRNPRRQACMTDLATGSRRPLAARCR
jgi:hypothetical protein